MSDQRSVKIDPDERGGWSSDRPSNRPPRPVDLTTRCRVLQPTDRMRYSPGSLLVVIGPEAADAESFAARTVEEKNAVLSLAKVRGLLAGRVAEEELFGRAEEVLAGAVQRRLEKGDATVLVAETLDPAERAPFLLAASKLRRPRHVLLLDAGTDEDRVALNELRRALDAGELGSEGFQTALRVGGRAINDLHKIVFRPEPRED